MSVWVFGWTDRRCHQARFHVPRQDPNSIKSLKRPKEKLVSLGSVHPHRSMPPSISPFPDWLTDTLFNIPSQHSNAELASHNKRRQKKKKTILFLSFLLRPKVTRRSRVKENAGSCIEFQWLKDLSSKLLHLHWRLSSVTRPKPFAIGSRRQKKKKKERRSREREWKKRTTQPLTSSWSASPFTPRIFRVASRPPPPNRSR